jgi:2-hydroxy-6-oxonona-2,4-dienedioate hydrolase
MSALSPRQADGHQDNGAVAGLTPRLIDVFPPAVLRDNETPTTAGIRTRYYEAGDSRNEPMVLIHGGGWSGQDSANIWSKNIPGLAKRFHVLAPDKLGSGLTANPLSDSDYTIQAEVEHMFQFVETKKLGRVHLVGQGRGGACALFLTVAHPEIVRTLTIVNSLTAAPVGPNGLEEIIAKCPPGPGMAAWQCLLQAISVRPEETFDDAFWAAARSMANLPKSREAESKMKGRPANGRDFDAWKQVVLERVQQGGLLQTSKADLPGPPPPVLIYWGRNDPSAVMPLGWALFDVVATQNPAARMITANDAGHFLFREEPEEFNTNVIDFIDYWENLEPPGTLERTL